MTFPNSNSLTSHLEELRSPNLPSTTSENSKGYTTPSRYSGSFMTTHSQSSSDGRANLQRRFTTDLGKMSTLTPIGQPPASKAEPVEISTTVATVCQSLYCIDSYSTVYFGDVLDTIRNFPPLS